MTTRQLVYVAGPYTEPDPVENTHKACRAATELIQSGLFWCIVPHISMLWHAITPLPYDVWLEQDFAHIARCDALLRLPGESRGADAEVVEAQRLGIPVFGDREELVAWARAAGSAA